MAFFVVVNEGSMLLSCKTTLMLGLIQAKTRLNYLLPRTSLITSSADHHKKTKSTLCVQNEEVSTQTSTQEVAVQMLKCIYAVTKLVTSKDQIPCEYPDAFEGIGSFPGPPCYIQIDPCVTPKQTPSCPIPSTSKKCLNEK